MLAENPETAFFWQVDFLSYRGHLTAAAPRNSSCTQERKLAPEKSNTSETSDTTTKLWPPARSESLHVSILLLVHARRLQGRTFTRDVGFCTQDVIPHLFHAVDLVCVPVFREV